MALRRILLPIVITSLSAFSGLAHASTLLVSVSGQFSSSAGTQVTQLWSPNATWSLSFDLNTNPAATNTDSLGFDAPFSSFTYDLNGSPVSTSPASIRFATTGNLGLFTIFFGPESGYANGNPIPEFSFEGPQLFSGTTSVPVFSAGSFNVSDWVYSDSSTYDENTAPSSVVTLAPVPEPASILLLGMAGLALAVARIRKVIDPT